LGLRSDAQKGAITIDKTVIEPAVPSDRDAILAITAITYAEHHERLPDEFAAKEDTLVQRWLDWHYAQVAESSQPPGSLVLVCRVDGAVVGHVILAFSNTAHGETQHDRSAWIVDISFRPEFRGRGLGRELLAQAADWASRTGATLMGGQVWQDNAASEAMFRQQGYSAVATQFRKRLALPIEGAVPSHQARPTRWWRKHQGDLMSLSAILGLILVAVILGLTRS
jgi:GNAT superfamily N-acetyltransferase